MKLTINKITEGEDEIILRYHEFTREVEKILLLLQPERKKLVGHNEKEKVIIDPDKVLYLESVDQATFAYLEKGVYRIEYTLSEAEALYASAGFFRCSKSMVINVWKVDSLKSLSCNRIDAKMENGEHVIISRTYATEFRRRLKGGMFDE